VTEADDRPGLPELPDFVPPMLAKIGAPFDSDAHLFEIKWDGMRALTFTDPGRLRLYNRQRVALVELYPDLGFLADLPPGVVLDGEIVVTREGKPDFHLVMRRQHARSPMRIRSLARTLPATYIVFDLLYQDFTSIMDRPLSERRERLRHLVEAHPHEKLILSDGIVGHGRALFEQASDQGLEGIVGKRLDSRYLPGRRTDAWLKMKRAVVVHCAIIGFLPDGDDDFKSLVIALDDDGELRSVGQVGSGIDAATRAELNRLLWKRLRDTPLVPSDANAKWVEPGLYCTVSYLERNPKGGLRAPVFLELVRG
jgi:DNA ligase D-like protein (predicted ligase)